MSSRAWRPSPRPRTPAFWAFVTLAACSRLRRQVDGRGKRVDRCRRHRCASPAPGAELAIQRPAQVRFRRACCASSSDRSRSTIGSMDSVHEVPNDSRRHYAYRRHARAVRRVRRRRRAPSRVDGGVFRARLLQADRRPDAERRLRKRRREAAARDRPLDANRVSPRIGGSSHTSRSTRVEPATTERRDHCDVSILHRDVTERVVAAARTGLTRHLADIDQRIDGVDLRVDTPRSGGGCSPNRSVSRTTCGSCSAPSGCAWDTCKDAEACSPSR